MREKKLLGQRVVAFTCILENNKVLQAIKDSFLMIVPVLLLGAIALIIRDFPVPWFQTFLNGKSGSTLVMILDSIQRTTYGLLSIFLAIGISYHYSVHFYNKNEFLRILVMVLAVVCLSISLGIGHDSFHMEYFGAVGVITAIIVPALSTRIFFGLYHLFYKIGYRRKARAKEIDYRHLETLVLPFVITILFFIIINNQLYIWTGVASINELSAIFFGGVFEHLGNSIGSGLLMLFIQGILWFFGIHGSDAMEQVVQNVFVPTHSESSIIISKAFIDTFGLLGGSGATICLLIVLLLFAKNKRQKQLGKASAFLVLFNVNEVLIFGLPIVLNPILILPFIITPLLSLTIAYGATCVGFLPVIQETVSWTTPVFWSGYAATGSINGAIVQFVCIMLGVVIYAPFVKFLEKVYAEQELIYVEKMEEEWKIAIDSGEEVSFIDRSSELGNVAVAMVERLIEDIEHHNIKLYYQPQMTSGEKIFGAEALLRWEYNSKKVFPPLVIQLAKERGVLRELSMEIMEQVCKDIVEMTGSLGEDIEISANVAAEQLGEVAFVEAVVSLAKHYHVLQQLSLEVTEEMALESFTYIAENIEKLRQSGIGVAMDDFSMGHTSLKCLEKSHFSHVKLDGELVCHMMENKRSKDIIYSIVELGKTLGFQVIAEYVDSEEKKNELIELGCDYLQGYLYSPAIPKEMFVEYYKGK